MSDEELTALAVKAFGNAQHGFSPLNDDGDALRLAAYLRFTIKITDHEVEIFDVEGECLTSILVFAQDIENVSGTVRRAIVTTAAAINEDKYRIY